MSLGSAVGGVAVGLGLAAAAVLGGQALVESRAPARIVTVKGLAEREVSADIAAWRLPFRGEGATLAEAIAEAETAARTVRAFLRDGGVDDQAPSDEPFALRVDRVYVDQGREERLRYTAVGAVRLRTADVDAVERLAAQTIAMLQQGVKLGEGDFAEAPRPLYLFTALNAIKPDLLADATRAARATAAQFAADSGAQVAEIVSANQGVVQLLARDGDFPERFERRKIVRVVSTVEYRLAD